MTATLGYAAHQPHTSLERFEFNRRELKDTDVGIDILYCGICHSDVHQVNNDWKSGQYPMVPGHEIIGRVKSIGKKVSRFAVGDLVGVGCLVDSCRTCANCTNHEEQFCEKEVTFTYNSADKDSGGSTYGGYSKYVVVTENFVLKVSESLNPAAAAPLLCAGITTYSPLKRAGIRANSRVGVVGLGGLGHMAVKLARAMGAHVTVFTTSTNKIDSAIKLGATKVVLSTDSQAMNDLENQYDFILDTVSAQHDMSQYLNLLKYNGQFTQVGIPAEPLELSMFPMILKRLNVSGSLIGGIKETQEMLDFCAKHAIVSDIELIDINQVNTAYERLLKGDVKYRFVIDMASLR